MKVITPLQAQTKNIDEQTLNTNTGFGKIYELFIGKKIQKLVKSM